MSRLQQFLPQMAQANAALTDELKRNPAAREKYDIERVSGDQAHVVQMELHCGVAAQPQQGDDNVAKLPNIVLPDVDDNDNDSNDNDNNSNDDDVPPKRPLIEELN